MPFQPNLMFGGKDTAYPGVEHLKGASLSYVRALLKNIRLGWKGMPRTNTLAYCAHLEVMKKVKFCEYGPRIIKVEKS